ncbi:hypothetical protein Vadar_032056 [Vaccinium darrowii]|uniref:Uncharacterized protein n=1 Tax=Vaccinium darrowii TaxID=229202 RepID=A0ACB7X5I3_9ERIC|nr:hypothetical protein Vadar_032056 [Vaccinium darrowii]
MDGKTKDNLKARLDLVERGIRHELHPQMLGSNKTYLPPACFSMVPKEKDDFLKALKGVKVPDGYASNLSRCIQLKQQKIIGMKSHDAHILMQQLLPIALRGSLPQKVVSPLIELSCYVRALCSKVLEVEELERLESQIAVTLCNLERIFPPSFFTVMVHLVVHLATEAKLAGPVQYRWMYPIERYLHRLKSYVRNKASPEGSIVEGYIAEECLTFCSRYLGSVETIFNRPARNVEGSTGAITNIELDQKSWAQAHRYVLFNSDEIMPFRVQHKELIKRQSRPRRLIDEVINRIHAEKFCYWFRSHVGVMDDTRKQQLGDKIKWLAQGDHLMDEPFVLASQASQVYYVKDAREKEWVVAVKTKERDVYDVGNGESEEGSADTYYGNEPYNLVAEDIPANMNENLDWSRNDANGITLDIPLEFDSQLMDDSESDGDVYFSRNHFLFLSYFDGYCKMARKRWDSWYIENNLNIPPQLHDISHPTPSRGALEGAQPHTTSQVHFPHGLQPMQSNASSRLNVSENASQPQNVEDNRELDYNSDDDHFAGCEVAIAGESKKRGISRLADVWNLPPTKRIVVEFNQVFVPVGKEGGLFNRFLGTIARKPHLCPISYRNWNEVPRHYKEDCWNIIQSKFVIPETNPAREGIKHKTLKALGVDAGRLMNYRKDVLQSNTNKKV